MAVLEHHSGQGALALGFALGFDHPVQHAIEKILAYGRDGLVLCARHKVIDECDEIDVCVHSVGRPHRAELLDPQLLHFGFALVRDQGGDLVRRADVDLVDDLGLAVDAGDLSYVQVGSAFFSS